jgi:hypothetical protein
MVYRDTETQSGNGSSMTGVGSLSQESLSWPLLDPDQYAWFALFCLYSLKGLKVLAGLRSLDRAGRSRDLIILG